MGASCKIAFAVAAMFEAGCTHLTPTPSAPPNFAPDPTIDEAYVNRVEQVARLNGVIVYWVNPPLKHAP